jgi:integrase
LGEREGLPPYQRPGETMAKTAKLTAIAVARANGPAVLHDGAGLYLRVSATGAKSWVFRYQLDGRRRDMGLGPFPDVSLADARAKAAAHRGQRREGADPIATRAAERLSQRLADAHARTFRQVAAEFVARNEAGWRNAKHQYQWRQTIDSYVNPVLGDLPVAAIDTNLVVQVLEQPMIVKGDDGTETAVSFWRARPETASRVRGRIEAVLDAATVRGLRQGPNPALWKGNLAHILPARSKVMGVEHYAALPFTELPAFFAALRGRPGTSARALEFTILTAARTGEVIGATWAEIDLPAKVWTRPAKRMKAGREHRVPLSDEAILVLDQVRQLAVRRDGKPDPAAPLFPGSRRALPMSNMVMLMLLRRMKRDDLTVHGFRSTFRDWCAERTSFPREVVEMALAHTIENKVEAAYRRGDLFEKRRQLMDAWARFCKTLAIGGEVVPLRAGA